MVKVRIYELARELNISTRELETLLHNLGISFKSHMSVLDQAEIARVKESLQPAKPEAKTETKTKTAAPPAPGGKERADAARAGQAGAKAASRPARSPHAPAGASVPQQEAWSEWERESRRGPRGRRPSKGKKADRPGRDRHAPRRGPEQVPVVKKISMGEKITVQELALRLARPAKDVIKKLMALGVMASLNQEIDADTASLVAAEYGTQVEVKITKPLTEIEDPADPPETLRERPPIVTVMGHVDHGKTSLLDAIRSTKVVATETGGITQHIGAYQVETKGRRITFLDTPGHEAFTAMRARGAQVTDIAVLVVAADDGVMPQTIEAINHAQEAGVPILVAINKIDRPEANPERIKQQLTEYGLVPEEWGGDTIMVPVSALKKQGIDQMLEMILLLAEISDLKANPGRPAVGTVIEAELDKGRGPAATVLVQKGILHVGDSVVVGDIPGKVRAMVDYQGRRVQEAGPSMPVQVVGLEGVPEAGDKLQVVEDERLARTVALARQEERKQRDQSAKKVINLDDFFKRVQAEQVKELKVILKADVQGSVEALRQSLMRLGTEEVQVRIIHDGVGAVTESDVMLAAASEAIIIGFNVREESGARRLAEQEKVDIRSYRIIYEVLDDIRKSLSGLLEPEVHEVLLGRAEVRTTFRVPRAGTVAGSYVLEGKMVHHVPVRIIRDGVVVYEGHLQSLRRFKDDVHEVGQGYECGIGLENFNDLKEGDVIEAYTLEKIERHI